MKSGKPKKPANLNVKNNHNLPLNDEKSKGNVVFNRFGARQTINHQHFNSNHLNNHSNNQFDYRANSLNRSNKISLVPSEVSSIHNSHLTNNCSNKKSANQNHSVPTSLLTTPSTSPATPMVSKF